MLLVMAPVVTAQPAPARAPDVPLALVRGDRCLLGSLDERGEFLPAGKLSAIALGPIGLTFSTGQVERRPINTAPGTGPKMGPVYEYRSGRLVPGAFDEQSYFVPEAGGMVIDYVTEEHGGRARPIRNLPRKLPTDWPECLTLPAPPLRPPPPAETAAERARTMVIDAELFRGDSIYVGQIDPRGEFLPGGALLMLPCAAMVGLMERGWLRCDVLTPAALAGRGSGPVYEYRSGRLIPGEIDRYGYFLPDMGGLILDYSKYEPGPGARPIYNLPRKLPTLRPPAEPTPKGQP
jgi:hypothetical protein